MTVAESEMPPPTGTEPDGVVVIAGPAMPPAFAHVLTVLVSIVTAPVLAYRPPVVTAPVLRVTDALARMLPRKLVELPSVALLPICHVTLSLLQGVAPPVNTTAELLAVTSVLPVLMTHAAFGSPFASRVSVPVRWTSETVKQ